MPSTPRLRQDANTAPQRFPNLAAGLAGAVVGHRSSAWALTKPESASHGPTGRAQWLPCVAETSDDSTRKCCRKPSAVMPGLVPGIHVYRAASKTWMASDLGLARGPHY